jgi:hypothetical protein
MPQSALERQQAQQAETQENYQLPADPWVARRQRTYLFSFSSYS